jgi:cation:H+ antiporter
MDLAHILGRMAIGLVGVLAGGELVVRGATGIAKLLRVPAIVIGLTVVAFGTSAPELAVTLRAAWAGEPDLAVGNVAGSNIFNVLVVLGIGALIAPFVVSKRVVRSDGPAVLVSAVILAATAADGHISRLDGLIMTLALVVFLYWTAVGRRLAPDETAEPSADTPIRGRRKAVFSGALNAAMVVGGLALLTVGSDWLIDGSTSLARIIGLSELVIGLTILAVGTSMPELVVSLVAFFRGAREVALGNVLGSNVLNVLSVCGLTALISPEGIGVGQQALYVDIPIVLAVSVACVLVLATGRTVTRWEGAVLLGGYVLYVGWRVWMAI